MDEMGSGTPPWGQQTVGERIVAAAWRAVAAHLAQQAQAQENQRVAAGGAGDIDPLTDSPTGPASTPAGHDRLR